MDAEIHELGKAFLELRRAQYAKTAALTKDLAPLELKADAAAGVITGHASKFWVVDSYAEVTAPQCFLQSITERGPQGSGRIPIRYEHQETCGAHTLMKEDDAGLYIEGHIKDDGACGTRLRVHLSEPDPIAYGLSIGYRNLKTRMATSEDPLIWDYAPRWMQEERDPSYVFVLEQVLLKENSCTVFPANDDAWVESFKADDAADSLERVLASLKTGTLSKTQIGLLREIAALLPADVSPESDQASPLPAAKSDSTVDADFAFLDLAVAEFERLVA